MTADRRCQNPNEPMIDELGNLNPMARSRGHDEGVVRCGTCNAPITTCWYGVGISGQEIEQAARWHRRHTGCLSLEQGFTRWENMTP